MKNKIKIGLIQMSMSPDAKSNLNNALKKIKEASLKKAEIVCLPELFNLQYFPENKNKENFKLAEEIPNKTTDALSKSARENKIILICGSIFEKTKIQKKFPKEIFFEHKYYNTCISFDKDGSIIGKYRKIHIPHDPHFYEKTFFTAGDKYTIFATNAAKIGTLICYDQWFPEAARINALNGAQIIFYPTAIGFTKEMKKYEPFSRKRWIRDQCSHASMNGIFVAAANRVGKEKEMEFWGSSFIADPFGNVIAEASDKKEEILIVEIDLSLITSSREGWRFLKNRRPETYGDLVKQ